MKNLLIHNIVKRDYGQQLGIVAQILIEYDKKTFGEILKLYNVVSPNKLDS